MDAEGGAAPAAAPAPPRVSGLLLSSLVLSGISLLVPSGLGPVGPLVAGVLAFLGYRAVRGSGGGLRGPLLARVAMTAALLLFAFMAWQMVRHAAAARAMGEIRGQVRRVEEVLRNGTAEGAWDLLGSGAKASGDRAAFVKALRAAMLRLGPLDSLGDAEQAGGDWDRTGSFEEGDREVLRLPMDLDGRFRQGRGRIRVEVVVRREGQAVASEIAALRVEPAAE